MMGLSRNGLFVAAFVGLIGASAIGLDVVRIMLPLYQPGY
jgi:hypothetical protein